jgi:hypothetical protein
MQSCRQQQQATPAGNACRNDSYCVLVAHAYSTSWTQQECMRQVELEAAFVHDAKIGLHECSCASVFAWCWCCCLAFQHCGHTAPSFPNHHSQLGLKQPKTQVPDQLRAKSYTVFSAYGT